MARWSKQIEKIIKLSSEASSQEKFPEAFLKPKNYLPQTDEEKKEFDEFSLVTSSMILLIHVAEADKVLKGEERERIISDLIFQLEQRPFEYDELAEKFGKYERDIISNMFDKLLNDYENGKLNLDEIIDIICMIYQNNPDKRYYLVRLLYNCAFADFDFDKAEKTAIEKIAKKLKVEPEEMKRIEKEVREEIANV